MPGIARQFEPQITRSGGAPSKYRFTLRCSKCTSADTYEAAKAVSNDALKGYFSDRGWLLGRAASFDVCPACLARPGHAQDRQAAPARHNTKSTDKRYQDTADILTRHLGRPKDLATEVFRPAPAKPAESSAPKPLQQTLSTPALSPEVEQNLISMAADMKGLRSAVEVLAGEVSKLVALGGHQIEALANLPSILAQSTEGLSDGLRHVARAIQSVQHLPRPSTAEQSVTDADAKPEQTQAVETKSAPASQLEVHELPPQARGKRKAKGRAGQSASAAVLVKSIADANGKDRFYTSIRMPRELWDSAGFTSEDRLLLDWSGRALSIERAAEGGVKPKAIGGTSVVLQSWKLGNVNFDQPKVTNGDGSLCLTARPSGAK
jgi:hypothetical protein